jgi:hypothetical protein
MMILFVGIYLVVFYTVILTLFNYFSNRSEDIFNPINILILLAVIGVPQIFLVGVDHTYLNPQVLNFPYLQDLEKSFLVYAGITSLAFLSLFAGVFSPFSQRIASVMPVVGVKYSYRRCVTVAFIAGVLGISIYLYYIGRIGGLANLWQNLSLRTQLMAGTGYYGLAFHLLLTISSVFFVYSLRYRFTLHRAFGIGIILLVFFILFASTGSRANPFRLIIACLFTWHYAVKPLKLIQLINVRALVFIVLLAVFFIAAPLFRASDSIERYSGDVGLLINDVGNNVETAISRLSALERDLVIVSYFSPDRYWLGRNYLDLLYAPIPRTVMPNKPPVDDGVYLKTIVDGRDVRPSMPSSDLSLTSWPLGHLVSYINFGIIGLILGMYLTGVLIGMSYNSLILTQASPFAIFIYSYVIINFNLTVHAIVTTIITFTIGILFFVSFFGLGRAKAKRYKVITLKGRL